MVLVVGYRDLRPLDWVSGKRMPLAPGEGHICDRCGREHAVLYEVLDDAANKTYVVGSGCAQKQFGFDVGKDEGAKTLVRQAKLASELELDARRHQLVREKTKEILAEVSALVIPEPVVEHQTGGPDVVRVGDGVAWVNFRSLEETLKVATRSWFTKRVEEKIPDEWRLDSASVSQRPPARTARDLRHVDSMSRQVIWACTRHLL